MHERALFEEEAMAPVFSCSTMCCYKANFYKISPHSHVSKKFNSSTDCLKELVVKSEVMAVDE